MAGRRKILVIARDDHIGEPIGAIFLEPPDGQAGVTRMLREYLGGKATIVNVELEHDRVKVEVEASLFADESARLAAAAADLCRKGAPRNALAMFKQALELDPLSGASLYQMAGALMDLKQPREALVILRRAREILGDSVDLLRALARAAVALERISSAVGYLERALEIEPANRTVRRELLALGRRPPPTPITARGTTPRRRTK